MGKVRYIGSKARIVDQILDLAGKANGAHFFDVFAGTGVVSHEAALRGWPVRANDHLLSASIATRAQLLSSTDVPFDELGGYDSAIQQLNIAPSQEGFIFREYTPSGKSGSGELRKYFTCENGVRIDGIRKQIDSWFFTGKLTEDEKSLLIADLFEAANTVANIAGTYGCFLSQWDASALRTISISTRTLLPRPVRFEVSACDVFQLRAMPDDLVYMDPPYTKRQYASYYHILETLAEGDAPIVKGVSGLRSWREKASPFCYKKLALDALLSLCNGIGAERVLISYNSQGHIPLDRMRLGLEEYGKVKIHEVAEIGRYRPNRIATGNGSSVTEYLIEFKKQHSRKYGSSKLFGEYSPSALLALAKGG